MDASTRVSLLLAPAGSLSGDGQLREVFAERRRRGGPTDLWFLAEVPGVQGSPQEAVASAVPHLLVWLQVRFGGELQHGVELPEGLRQPLSLQLPPAAAAPLIGSLPSVATPAPGPGQPASAAA